MPRAQICSLVGAAAPLLRACRAVGLAPFALVPAPAPRRLAACRRSRLYGALVLALETAVWLFNVAISFDLSPSRARPGIFHYLDRVTIVICFMSGIVQLRMINMHAKKILKFLEDLQDVHSVLGVRSASNFQIIHMICSLQLFAMFLGTMLAVWPIAIELHNKRHLYGVIWFVVLIAYTFVSLQTMLGMTLYINIALLISFYFQTINLYMARNHFSKQSIYTVNTPPEVVNGRVSRASEFAPLSIRDVRLLHFRLQGLVEDLNGMLAPCVGLEVVNFQFLVTSLLFQLVCLLNRPRTPSDVSATVVCLTFVSLVLAPVWKLAGAAAAGERVAAQAARTSQLVHALLLQGPSGGQREELRRFAEELQAGAGEGEGAGAAVELRVAGGIRLGLRLLWSAIGAAASYLVVLLQFVK